MRKVIVSNLMSLDGFFEGPNREIDWFLVEDEFFEYAKDMLRSAETLIFGRVTYEHMAAYWPTAPSDEIADKMNSLPKLVFSKTLESAGWNNTRVVRSDLSQEIARLRQEPGKDIVVLGSAKLASAMLRLSLVDEYRVLLQPILLGKGNLLFQGFSQTMRLKLGGTKLFGSGVILLRYQKL
jgi:dihydrofolate reductase